MHFELLYSEPPFKRWHDGSFAIKFPEVVDEYLKKENFKKTGDKCFIEKDIPYLNKKRTGGIQVIMYGCGIVVNFAEIIRSESLHLVVTKIKYLLEKSSRKVEFCIYDNGCHLDETVQKIPENNNLKSLKFLIDRFHIKNHVRSSCKKYSADNFSELKLFNTQICEQTFSHISKYKHMTKHMSKNHFNFFYLWLLNELNVKNFRDKNI